jgi:CheY-like chemotaxis protein
VSATDSTLIGVALIADGDLDRGKAIAEACATRGLVTRFASHGAEALEAALGDPPDVVVAALGLPLIDAPQLAGILRANPRTQGVRFVVIGGAPGEPLAHAAIDARVAIPVDADAVLRRIESLLVREKTVSEPKTSGASDRDLDLEGKLAHLGLADLLQLFHMNRKTGTVELLRRAPDGGEERGLVAVTDGNVVDARCGLVEGEKALHRLLGWRTGNFTFLRTRPTGPARIHTPTRALLLEGMRQLDELARLRAELPSLDAEISFRVSPTDLPPVVQPLTREVLRLLETFPCVGDVVDRSAHPDYQVLRTLQALVERGIIELHRGSGERAATAAESLFSGAQLGRLREWAQRTHGSGAPLRDARLLMASPDPAVTRSFLQLLEGLPDVSLDRSFREGRFSASTLRRVGRLGPEQEVGIELLHLPTHASCEPLWTLAAHAALGILFLVGGEPLEATRSLQPLRRRIDEEGRLRTFHAVLAREGKELPTRDLLAALAPATEATLFQLPLEEGRDARPVLAQLLSRLVP